MLKMTEIQKTNICCLDLNKDCIAYFKSLGLNVFDGTLGSILSFDWNKIRSYRAFIKPDFYIPSNLHEYHVYVVDTDNAKQRVYISEEHESKKIDNSNPRRFSCESPINILDIRPLGGYFLSRQLQSEVRHKLIKILFLGPCVEVEYTTDSLTYHDPHSIGIKSNYDAWGILKGSSKYGQRVKLEDNKLSKLLFDGRKNNINYYSTFQLPITWNGDKEVTDPKYVSLLNNEDGECISYLFFNGDQGIVVALPQVEDKVGVLKDLFEVVIFKHFSDFFPDIESKRWIHNVEYELPEERAIREKIALKREEYENTIAELEKEAEEAGKKNVFLKNLLTGTGDQLVKAVKTYLEWLGFTNVIDKDETLEEGEIKEEDLNLTYNGQLVLLEVKGINGTSTDAECSQVNKIVLRRMKQLKTTDVHGVYIVNNQKNVEPLCRQVPPFNENQISDAENQDRTMIYTTQLFALFSDIENGYVKKEEARECFLKSGLANFHSNLTSLGIPYDYFQKDTVVCLELDGVQISVGDTLYFKDSLNKLVGCKVESIQQDKQSISTATTGKVGIKMNIKVHRNRELYK